MRWCIMCCMSEKLSEVQKRKNEKRLWHWLWHIPLKSSFNNTRNSRFLPESVATWNKGYISNFCTTTVNKPIKGLKGETACFRQSEYKGLGRHLEEIYRRFLEMWNWRWGLHYSNYIKREFYHTQVNKLMKVLVTYIKSWILNIRRASAHL